jgi:hypothetical protein
MASPAILSIGCERRAISCPAAGGVALTNRETLERDEQAGESAARFAVAFIITTPKAPRPLLSSL